MNVKVYEYAKCSTCRNATKFLDTKKIKYEKIPIVDTPPKMSELKQMLKFLKARGLGIKNMFNTSGELYREMKMSDKLKGDISSASTETELLELLSKHGKLVKRPFVLAGDNGVVGFKEEEWKKLF